MLAGDAVGERVQQQVAERVRRLLAAWRRLHPQAPAPLLGGLVEVHQLGRFVLVEFGQ